MTSPRIHHRDIGLTGHRRGSKQRSGCGAHSQAISSEVWLSTKTAAESRLTRYWRHVRIRM